MYDLQFVDERELFCLDMMSRTHDGPVTTEGGAEAPPEHEPRPAPPPS